MTGVYRYLTSVHYRQKRHLLRKAEAIGRERHLQETLQREHQLPDEIPSITE
ncbi:MAG: hypothetical protein AB2693_17240 [Candidatus Thiodiazotropha sp.]